MQTLVCHIYWPGELGWLSVLRNSTSNLPLTKFWYFWWHIWPNYCIPLCPIFGANYTLQGHTMDNYSSVASWLILLLLIIIIGFIIIQVSHASWKIANSFSRSWKSTWILQNHEKSWNKYCLGPLKWTKWGDLYLSSLTLTK